MRFLERRALARASRVIPRTLRFVTSSKLTGSVAGVVPTPALSPGFVGGVAMDEALLALAMAPSRFPRRVDYTRVSDELADARRLFSRRGWIARPSTYHRTPPPLRDVDISTTRGWAVGLDYERLAFTSEFTPRPSEPGGQRWSSYRPNHRAFATVLRHDKAPRPWAVCVHGFGMGYPFMDFVGLHTAKLHRQLGYNVVLPVLPLHGQRKVTFIGGEPFMSFDLMNTVHGLTQAVWDVRRLLRWIRDQEPSSVVLYGVSLGAYVVSLLAGIEDGIDAVVAGIPVVDMPRLFHAHSPLRVRARSFEHQILGGTAESVFRVVAPLSFAPKVPKERRYLYAGAGDRVALPEQARLLWEHWDQPTTCWYAGNHVGYLWFRQVDSFVDSTLREVFAGAHLLKAQG